jgi:uncharacterized protein
LFYSEKYGYLLYNAETNIFANLSKDMFDQLKKVSNEEISINELDADSINQLLQKKVLVKDKNEYVYRRRLRYYYQAFDTSNLGLAVAPTTACNFVCPYCYEENKKYDYMSQETEQDLLKFIDSHKRTHTLNLTWYGGEPLMRFGSIVRILEGMKNIKHIKLGLHNMTTNGYLLDENVSLFFKENPIDSIQVTIDGTREYHNQSRILPNNKPTYDTILKNIDGFMNHNPDKDIIIRMNLHRGNIHIFGQAYNELTKYWKGRKFFIYPAFIQRIGNNCRVDCSVTREEKIAFFKELKDRFNIKIAFKANNNGTGLCGATRINYYVVGPVGEMYKCWNDLGIESKIVGYLNSDKQNNELHNRYIAGPSMLDEQECRECSILPICVGNCLWFKLKNIYEGTNHNLCCVRKDNLDKTIELQYEETLKSRTDDEK